LVPLTCQRITGELKGPGFEVAGVRLVYVSTLDRKDYLDPALQTHKDGAATVRARMYQPGH